MTLTDSNISTVGIDCNLVLRCLDKVLNSPIFASAPKQQKLLKYLVDESHSGNGGKLKGYTIATEALGARPEFDSNHDSSVRVNAKRLRENLYLYYRDLGELDEVHFHLAIGSYEVIFLRKLENTQETNIKGELPIANRRKGCDRRIATDRHTQEKTEDAFN